MNKTKKIRAIGLLSGGLDSTLAVKVILDQGIDIIAVNFVSPFCLCNRNKAQGCRHEASRVAKHLGVPIKTVAVGPDYLDMVKNPEHGYGKNMNPCIDCRIYMHRKAGELMRELDAQFIFTGEVLGQRPMSQRRDALNVIDRESNLKGLVLRPLSAKVLSPTIPEQNGLVDREQLLRITGRGRKPQIELAKQYGLDDYACPAGGCLLTDPGFSRRLKDLITCHPGAGLADILLLKTGRHHRLPSGIKLVIGRNKDENERLHQLKKDSDVLLQPLDLAGATGLLKLDHVNGFDSKSINLAAGIILYYSGIKDSSTGRVKLLSSIETIPGEVSINAADLNTIKSIRL